MATCGECRRKHTLVIALLSNGVCPRCGTDYGSTELAEATRAETHDHARAGERAERIAHLTEAIIDVLVGEGMSGLYLQRARVAIFHTLAHDIYGKRAIDVPDFQRVRPAAPDGGHWPDLVAAELEKGERDR